MQAPKLEKDFTDIKEGQITQKEEVSNGKKERNGLQRKDRGWEEEEGEKRGSPREGEPTEGES